MEMRGEEKEKKRFFSTGEIAKHCEMSRTAVSQWIKKGLLEAFMTPGRHYRVKRADLAAFLKKYGFPPIDEEGE